MFCKHCGKEIKDGSKFCVYCGQSTSVTSSGPKTTPRFSWLKNLIIVCAVVLGLYGLFLLADFDSETYADLGILYELDPGIEPVGYFSEPSLFDSEDISDEDWLSYIEYNEQPSTENSIIEANTQRFPNQLHTYSTIIKIVCREDGYYYYGSGTNLDSAGYVVTNLHVLEGGADLECAVGFPDPESGLIREAYWATPIIDDEDETGYDLALLSIEEPIVDEEYNLYGFYEKLFDGTFPHYEETDLCLEKAPELGEHVFVIGYPFLSGGALTITDGLISSLYSSDGYLITSAKIGSGNSGGLAIDSGGCFVGVPTAVYSDYEDESYGEIIDAYFVYEFLEAVSDDIDEYREELAN